MGWPLPNKELIVINHSGLSDPIPAKELTDVAIGEVQKQKLVVLLQEHLR